MNKQRKNSKIMLLVIGVVTLILSAQVTMGIGMVHAQIDGQINSEYSLLSPLPCLNNGCPGSNGSNAADFKTYIGYVYNLLIASAAVVAVFMIVLGGFEYVTSTIPGVKTEGMKRIQSALWGLLLILGSYLILSTINPRLVQIPSTLVPQITLQGSSLVRNTNGDFYSQLDSEAAQDASNNHAASAASVAARDAAAQAQINYTNTDNQIMDALGATVPLSDQEIDDECASNKDIQQLCADRANYANQVTTNNSIQASQTLLADFNTALQNAATNAETVDSATLLSMRNNLDLAYANEIKSVTDPNQIKTVNDQYLFASQKLEIQQYVALTNTGSPSSINGSIALISAIKANEAPDITDPTTRANAQQAADSAVATLQKYYQVALKNAQSLPVAHPGLGN